MKSSPVRQRLAPAKIDNNSSDCCGNVSTVDSASKLNMIMRTLIKTTPEINCSNFLKLVSLVSSQNDLVIRNSILYAYL